MKYYLLFIILNLAIIFAYADFEDKGQIRIEKMQNHLRKIKGILRNLDTSDEDDDEDDSTDDEDSSENDDNPTNPNTTQPDTNTTQPDIETETPTTSPVVVTLPSTPKKETKNRDASVHLIGFNSFKAPPEATLITFRTFFNYKNIRPARWVIIRIVISIRLYRLRYLDEDSIKYENANCTINPEDEDKLDGNVRYDCSAPKSANVTVTNASVYNVEINEPNLTVKDEDINYSEEAALAAISLYSQTKETEKIFTLYNGKLTTYSDYFIINGKINDTDFYRYGINDPLILQVTDETQTPSKPYNVSCKATSLGNENYEFRCTPEEGVKGTIFEGTIRDSKKHEIAVNIASGKYTLDYSKNATENANYNKGIATYRKSSSGLSGGAIAGIVIACVVVLIIASLVAIMMRKSAAAAAPFQSQTPSIVGLRSVDNNYSQ